MPYISIDDFQLGMDTRKPRVTGVPGSLIELKNGHITRGGHIQRSKKFVSKFTLPSGTNQDACAQISITGGTSDPGVNTISSVDVGGTELLGSAVDWTTDDATTAQAVVDEINANTSAGLAHGYTATLVGNVGIEVCAPAGSGSADNGKILTVTGTGDVAFGGDPYWDQTKFLLVMENSDGGSDGNTPTEQTGLHDVGTTVRDVDYTQTGNHGKFADFDGEGTWSTGTAEYIFFDDHADYKPTGKFTIECWIKPGTSTDERVIASKGAITGKSWKLTLTSTNLFQIDWSGSATILTSNDTCPDDFWSHVAVVRNAADEMSLWVNGVKQTATATVSGGPASSVEAFTIALQDNTFDDPWLGGIDDFRITHDARYTADFSANLPENLDGSEGSQNPFLATMTGGQDTKTTFYLHQQGDNLFVFGGFAEPAGMPSGVTYQRLAHKDFPDSVQISKVLDAENFDGKIYAIAEFTDGAIYHYYDGSRVTDWDDISSALGDNDSIASALKNRIDLHPDFVATVAGSVLTIEAAETGPGFTISETAQNFGTVNDQEITLVQQVAGSDGSSEVLATGSVSITGGSPNTAATGSVELTGGGAGSVDSITVDGVEIMSGAESFDSDLDTTAAAVAANITAHTSSPDYNATADGAVITISALQSAGADPNGFAVVSSATTITTSDTNMASGATNALTALTVDGVSVITNRVNYAPEGSNSETATDLAAEITGTTSSPDYDASASGGVVTITAKAGTGAGPNGFVVNRSVVGDMTAGTTNMQGGAASGGAAKEKWDATISGTFEPEDVFTITLNGQDFTVQGAGSATGTTALTFKKKMYVTASSLLYFSGINNPTVWAQIPDPENASEIGAGFLNFSNQDSGSETLTGTGIYQGNIAVFARSVTQIEFVDVDEEANTHLHTVRSTGTRAHRSVTQFGNHDLFYLDEDLGIRSLRARDSSNAPSADDVGTPIDDHVLAYIATITEAEAADAVGLIGPDGRFWLSLKSRIYVFSFFKNSKISAWSYYEPGFDIEMMVRLKNQIFLRDDDTIYLYGGDTGTTFPDAAETPLTINLPFIDLDKAAHQKSITAFDFAALNEFDCNILVNPNDETDMSTEFTLSDITYPNNRVGGLSLRSSHFAPRLICDSAGNAELYNLVIHYELEDAG